MGEPMTIRVVGIGASAGGLEAVGDLLGALPNATGMAFVVVQHLDPYHESLLPELLQKKTPLAVALARADEVVQPDRVYIIPPNTTLTVAGGRFHLAKRPASQHHLPVDALFTSLAAEYADDAIGVVLSGGDSDGSLGIQAIKHDGGMVFAQRPDSARFPNMPRHAIETGCVDRVLSPIEIAHELERIGRQASRRDETPRSDQAATGDAADEDDEDEDDELLKLILRRLRSAHGLDFTNYRRNTLRRRLRRRMALRAIESVEEYRALIESDPQELAALNQDFLIRVTDFFRDSEPFDALGKIFAALREGRDAGKPIRIWVPGCATGEEVYSLAIVLFESEGDRLSPSNVQIFGTDVSEAALEKARAGVYLANIERDVSSERLQRFFERRDNGYRVLREIRDLCIFARQDVTRDPPFPRLDLVSCRNLLIYLGEAAQRRVLQAFHFALRPNGTLLLGSAESAGQSSELFEQLDKRLRIYRRRPGSGLDRSGQRWAAPSVAALETPGSETPLRIDAESLLREADRWLLARYAPASLLIDEALNIQQFRGRTGPYLEPAGGPPSVDLRRVVRPELLVELLALVRQARETGSPAHREVRFDEHDVRLEVVPLTGSSGSRSLLILLDDGSHPARGSRTPPPPTEALPESEKDRRIAELQHDIQAMHDYLRSAIEEHGAIEEELKAAHEEMLSINEELQSSNEELETSKEELQSVNEELATTNEELRSRNRDLGALNVELEQARAMSQRALEYADAIIEAVPSPLAVVDAGLRIKRVNAAFLTDLEIEHDNVERLLIDEASGAPWNAPELHQKLSAVLGDSRPMDDWEVTLNLRGRGRRVVILSARKIPADHERAHLILLAIEDVTDRAQVADLVVDSRQKDEFLAMLAHELRHPLTPITHAIHLLRRAEVEPETAALYETIDTETRRLTRFVTELVDVVRTERGYLRIARERLDLTKVVEQAAESVRPMMDLHRHALTVTIGHRPIVVDGDAGRLNQVVTNLLENSAKYTETGGRIALTLELQGNEAVLKVLDNGVGIAQKDLARIFEPFTQIDSPLGQRGGGLGLGLSVVRRVLDLHGGRIEARSAGHATGSEFTVWLPTVGPPADGAAQTFSASSASSAVAASRTRKVLIVDDREEITRSLKRLLTAWEHEVTIATNAASALSLAATFQPDCAIVDLGLPVVSGYDLARRLREMYPSRELLLIAFTGKGDAGVSDKCRAAGFDACVVKPGDPDLLEELLRH